MLRRSLDETFVMRLVKLVPHPLALTNDLLCTTIVHILRSDQSRAREEWRCSRLYYPIDGTKQLRDIPGSNLVGSCGEKFWLLVLRVAELDCVRSRTSSSCSEKRYIVRTLQREVPSSRSLGRIFGGLDPRISLSAVRKHRLSFLSRKSPRRAPGRGRRRLIGYVALVMPIEGGWSDSEDIASIASPDRRRKLLGSLHHSCSSLLLEPLRGIPISSGAFWGISMIVSAFFSRCSSRSFSRSSSATRAAPDYSVPGVGRVLGSRDSSAPVGLGMPEQCPATLVRNVSSCDRAPKAARIRSCASEEPYENCSRRGFFESPYLFVLGRNPKGF